MALEAYHFPGNVRELKNIIEHALIKSRGQAIQPVHLHFIESPPTSAMTDERSAIPPTAESFIQQILSEGCSYSEAVDIFRQQLVKQVLNECGGNRHEAARRMGMHRPNLIQLIKRLGIEDADM